MVCGVSPQPGLLVTVDDATFGGLLELPSSPSADSCKEEGKDSRAVTLWSSSKADMFAAGWRETSWKWGPFTGLVHLLQNNSAPAVTPTIAAWDGIWGFCTYKVPSEFVSVVSGPTNCEALWSCLASRHMPIACFDMTERDFDYRLQAVVPVRALQQTQEVFLLRSVLERCVNNTVSGAAVLAAELLCRYMTAKVVTDLEFLRLLPTPMLSFVCICLLCNEAIAPTPSEVDEIRALVARVLELSTCWSG